MRKMFPFLGELLTHKSLVSGLVRRHIRPGDLSSQPASGVPVSEDRPWPPGL